MGAINTFQRYEKKFLVNKEVLDALIPFIEEYMDPDEYCEQWKTYPVSNLYYDTENSDVIRESLHQPFYKEKLRMRSYGSPVSERAPVFLELKKKINGIVTKRRAKLTYAQAKRFMAKRVFPDTQDYMTEQVLKEIQYYLKHNDVKAMTRISYNRRAYFGKNDPDFRLTIDQDLYYMNDKKEKKEVNFQDPQKGKKILPDNLYLMEVKVRDAYPLWFAKMVHTEGIFPVSFSKYGVSYKIELMNKLQLQNKQLDILMHI